MKRILLPVLATLAIGVGGAGCYAHGDYGASYSYGYAAPAPDLYYMSPGVSVVAYSDYPVFYSDNYYWRYDNGLWYRSGYYNGGWSVHYDVPYRVRSIQRPHSYARFTPGTGWSRAPAPRYNGGYNGGVRDHRSGYGARGYNPPARTYQPPARTYQQQPARTYQPPARQAPPVRDHRAPATYSPPSQPSHRAPPPGPAKRDHRR